VSWITLGTEITHPNERSCQWGMASSVTWISPWSTLGQGVVCTGVNNGHAAQRAAWIRNVGREPGLRVDGRFAFPRLVRQDGTDRRHTHAIRVFDKPVLIGLGR